MTSAPTLDQTRRMHPGRPVGERTAARPAPRQWPWLLGGPVGAFTVPFVFADVLGLDRDVYYGLYILFVGVLCVSWARSTRVDARAMMLRNWRAGVSLGAVFAAVTSLMVIRTEDATSHPQGLAFVGAIVWRGVLYGMTDGVLLSVFPILVVFAAFRGKTRRGGKVAVGALALATSLLFTAVYHVGYPDFRGEKLQKPLAGDLVWSVPTLLTLSPIGSPIAHAGLHVTAVLHSYDTGTFLPPHAMRPDIQSIAAEALTDEVRKRPHVGSVTAPMLLASPGPRVSPDSALDRTSARVVGITSRLYWEDGR
jgi:hypothetical protein